MRTMQRAIAMVGLTLMTGGVLGVTATAASAAPSEESATQSVERHRDDRDGDRDRWRHRDRNRPYIQGVYPSQRICKIVGWSGDRQGRWEDPRCVQIGRRAWVLWVEPDNDRRWRGHR